MKFSTFSVLAFSIRLGFTSPISPPNLQTRDSIGITASQLANFQLFAQYSTAAYCTNVVDNPNTTLIACAANGGNCSLVESAKGFLVDSFFHLGSQDTTGYVAVDPTNKLIVVAFQGTPGLDNPASLLDDVEITRDKTDICGTANANDGCEIHHGFLDSWNDAEANVTAALNSTVLAYPDHKMIFTGHSLGAAIAAIGATVTRNSGRVVDLYTYGQPRIGSQDISTYITNQSPTLGNNYRVTDFDDEVPQLPPHSAFPGEDWDHISPEYWISINGTDILPTDIHVITTPLFSTAGNSGFSLANSSITAHKEYFGHISGCD